MASCGTTHFHRVSTNLTEHSSRRFQEGFQEKSRTCLHCFDLLCNVPNRLVCLNIEQKHDMHNMGAVAKIKRATSFLNKWSGTQFYHDWKSIKSIIDILHKNFQEDHTNSRRFPGVVDTLFQWCKLKTTMTFSDMVTTKVHCLLGQFSAWCHSQHHQWLNKSFRYY